MEAEKAEQEKGPEEKSEENKEGRKEEAMETDENKVRAFTFQEFFFVSRNLKIK